MTAEDRGPVRLTRKRALALLSAVEWGIEAEKDSISQATGLKWEPDGTLTVPDGDFELLSEEVDLEDLSARLGALIDIADAVEIIQKRYLS